MYMSHNYKCCRSIILNGNRKHSPTQYQVPEALYTSPSNSTTSDLRTAFVNEASTSLSLGNLHNTEEVGNMCKVTWELTGPE